MTDTQIIEETLRYISDKSYNYAILIDGEWGCGKTFFVQNILKGKIERKEQESSSPRKVKYVSLYGCKSIHDVQENMIWGFADEAKESLACKSNNRENALELGSNILASSRKIGNAILKKFIPEANAYDIASDWLAMKSYIFIFDDLERCDCPLNEVFGFINGLVEHEGAKVILVANEREIFVKEEISQIELQYAVVLNEKIKWPVKEDAYGRRVTPEDKVSLELLEERRKLLFADSEVDETYQKIREKLIGVKLSYQPDVKEIVIEIINKSDMVDGLKEELLNHINFFCSFMGTNGHHNLRTFQFFLSKICYLYIKFDEIVIEDEYQKKALSFLIQDCFRWAVRFKGNVSIPTERWAKALYEAQRKSAVIKAYVETGEFDEKLFREDIVKYVEEELKNKLAEDDPLNLLYSQYYFHTQKWCEERLEEIKQKLQNNKYQLFVYQKIIVLLVTLVEIGFSDSHMIDIKALMLKNIVHGNSSIIIDDDLFFIENKERKQKALEIINKLNAEILAKDRKLKQKTIEELLSDESWVEELKKYFESNWYKSSKDISVFSKATSSQWIQAIMKTSVEDIDVLRSLLHCHYSSGSIREGIKIDLPVIRDIAEGINPEEETDVIKKLNLTWLKEMMETIGDLHERVMEENVIRD